MQAVPRVGKFIYVWISTFCLLFIFSFPVAFEVLPDLSGAIGNLITPILEFLGRVFFGINNSAVQAGILSDSMNMYLLCFVCCSIGLVFAIIWTWKLKEKIKIEKWTFWFMQIARYYLVIQMFQYGLNKLFKFQFFFPEPNTLFTTIGQSSKDILFWSAMGSSYEYTVFAGVVELVCACLLLLRKTRVLGALLLAGVMFNVMMINFSFDISVKLLSTFLFLLCILIIVPDFKRLVGFFIRNRVVEPAVLWKPKFVINQSIFYKLTKVLLVAFVIMDAFFPYVKMKSFNDDLGPKPYLHGAYQVTSLSGDQVQWKNAFVHREGYFIIQDWTDKFSDYEMQVDTIINVISVYENQQEIGVMGFRDEPGFLKVFGKFNNERVDLLFNKIDLSSLPISENDFHWTTDDYLFPTTD